MRLLLPVCSSSSNEEAVDECSLCSPEEISHDVSALPGRMNTNDISLVCVQSGRSGELWYHCVVCLFCMGSC
jgi:hypothetical protein